MTKKIKLSKRKKLFLIVWAALLLAVLMAIILIGFPEGGKSESVKEMMKDAVLHEENKLWFFGLEVNPAVVSAYTVTAILLIAALFIRIFAIPRFKYTPGKLQSIIEKGVEFFSGMASENSPHKPSFVGAYIFSAGIYIGFSTIFELFGIQAITTHGTSIALPAPLADINAAIAMGFTSFIVILVAGIVCNGIKGAFKVLKDFSLPISMSFRLFGALLSGLLVTELVYYYASLSFVLPVIVGILFTLLHALIQAYVLTTLVSIFYGEAVEPKKSKIKKVKAK
ncbi:MAG: F0F1 ATP synthase subunit A [Ruminococcus sp.]